MTESDVRSPWKLFWDRGGWWKALLAVVVYYVLYQLGGVLISVVLGGSRLKSGSAESLVVNTGLPILLGGVILVLFAWSIGWLKDLFGRQAIRGRGWMWVAIAVVLATNVLRFVALDYGKAGLVMVLSWLLVGLFIGFAEELLTRGFVVQLMRKAGHPEIAVALVSAAIFAAMHSANIFDGQGGLATIIQVGYTFAFGLLMYLAYRVTGLLIVPILLHASTDPSIFLLTAYPGSGALSPLAATGNIWVILTGIVLLIVLIFSGGKDRAFPRSPSA